MKLAFTTLGCPDWSWNKILDEAIRLGYQGIELRGIEGEFFLPKARPFLPVNIEETIAQLKNKGLEICALDSSCAFHDAARFDENIYEGKATIDLAEKLKVPYIRVFGNDIPDPAKKDETVTRVAEGLKVLCEYCEGKNVMVLLETHGDFSLLDHLLPLLETVQSPYFGVLWDIKHTYALYGEDNSEFFSKTAKYIKHTHIKDARKIGDDYELCLTGQGSVPIKKDIELLKSYGYDGYLSFEWEKRWVPQLEDPEIAFPGYIDFVKKLL